MDFEWTTDAMSGPRMYAFRPMLQSGATWRRRQWLIDAGWSMRPQATLRYPVSRTAIADAALPSSAFWIGAHRTFDATRLQTGAVRRGEMAALEQRWRASGKLSGPTLAAGLSSPILTGAADFNRTERPWLAPRARGRAMLDVGAGWYFDGLDAHVNVAWRRAAFSQEAFGFSQQRQYQSFALEAAKSLFDYHGFVPFVGPVVSMGRLRLRERDGASAETNESQPRVSPGLLLGWDIRPTRAEQFLLRTNLRWHPRLMLTDRNGRVQETNHLEFNFIQVVWYPRRR